MMFPVSRVLCGARAGAGMLVLQSKSGWSPAGPGRRDPFVPCVGMSAALTLLAPALPRPPGTVRHVPTSVGPVLLASATAAGVLAISRGCVWGRLSPCPSPCPERTDTCALAAGHRTGRCGGAHAQSVFSPTAVLLAATALVRVAGASGRETGHRSHRAAEEGPAMPRRLLAVPRDRFGLIRSRLAELYDRFDHVMSQAREALARHDVLFAIGVTGVTGATNPQ
jgi:hypothetical protein